MMSFSKAEAKKINVRMMANMSQTVLLWKPCPDSITAGSGGGITSRFDVDSVKP